MHLTCETLWWLCNLSIFQAHLIQSILYASAKWFLSKYISSSVNYYRSKFSMAPHWLEKKLTLSFRVSNGSVIYCQYWIDFLFLHWLLIWIAIHLQTITVHFWNNEIYVLSFFAHMDAPKLSCDVKSNSKNWKISGLAQALNLLKKSQEYKVKRNPLFGFFSVYVFLILCTT